MPNNILILFRVWQLYKFPNFKRPFLKTSIMAHDYDKQSSIEVHVFGFGFCLFVFFFAVVCLFVFFLFALFSLHIGGYLFLLQSRGNRDVT